MDTGYSCMQDTFARATHSAYAAGRPSAARDDRVSCIQWLFGLRICVSNFHVLRSLNSYLAFHFNCLYEILLFCYFIFDLIIIQIKFTIAILKVILIVLRKAKKNIKCYMISNSTPKLKK